MYTHLNLDSTRGDGLSGTVESAFFESHAVLNISSNSASHSALYLLSRKFVITGKSNRKADSSGALSVSSNIEVPNLVLVVIRV